MAHRKGFITRQARRLSDGEINRRRFVMSALSAGVTLPTAMSLASKAEGHAPKSGGHFRMGIAEASLTDTLDPSAATNGFTRLLAFARGNALTEITAKGEIIGELADRVETPDHGATWHASLRNGIAFHDGKALTSEDVQVTFQRHRDLGGLLSDVAQMTLRRGHITFHLARPDPGFADRLADPRLIVLPADATDPATGTGPYRLTEFTPSKCATFTRNPNYWKAGRAHFETVELIALPDMRARQQAIMTGDVDYADAIDPRALALLQRVPALDILETPGTRHLALTSRGAGKALEQIVPDRTLLEQLLLGHGSMNAANNTPDPSAARRLFRTTGGTAPIRIGLRDAALPGLPDAARLIAAEAENAGLPVEIRARTDGTTHAEIGWTRTDTGDAYIAVLANDLAAHARALNHGDQIATNLENDGARITERWWFG